MRLSGFLATLFGTLLLTNCTGAIPTVGKQSDVHQLYTTDPQEVAFAKVLSACERERCIVVRSDAKAGTIHATAYRGKVSVFMLIRPVRGDQTRVEAIARTEPGTFSVGKLDLAGRILDRYEEGQ
jgi:hypothetical protein